MVIYSVHERENEAGDISGRADKIFFVRDGFAWVALLFPILWLLYHRMWWVLAGFFALIVALQAGGIALGLGEETAGSAAFIVNAVFAFLANDLRRRGLESRGYSLVELVSGRNLAECEERFFTDWLARQEIRADKTPGTGPGPGKKFDTPVTPPGGSSQTDSVIGLFPEPAK